MKKVVLLSVALLFVASLFSFKLIDNQVKPAKPAVAAKKIEMYYFHYDRRCVTCVAVEEESKKALLALYPAQMKNGQIAFKSVNLDDDASKAVADKYKVSGQSLIIASGVKTVDLTDKGFMYAKTNPEKLKQEIKKVVDSFLNSK